MSDNTYWSESDLMKAGRIEIQISDGKKVLARRISIAELAVFLEHIPDVSALATVDPAKIAEAIQARSSQGKTEKAINGVCRATLLQPKLYDNPEEGPTPFDLPFEDRLTIFNAVLKFSNFGIKEAKEILPFSKTAG